MTLIRKLDSVLSPVFKGFMAGFLAIAFAVFWFLKDRVPMDDLPIIPAFTNAYHEGMASLPFPDAHSIALFYRSSPAQRKALTRQNTPEISASRPNFSPADPLHIRSYWTRDKVLVKLRSSGFSRGKLRAAGRILDYIEQHRLMALQSMRSTNVPASIKLAQAILESGAGHSQLAKATNNHFGIKAPAGKSARAKIKARQFRELRDEEFVYRQPAIGAYNFHDDNRYDRFEVYATVGDSYQRHNQLLTKTCRAGTKGCYSWIWDEYQVGQDYDISAMAKLYQPSSGIAPDHFFNGRTIVPYYGAAAAGLKMSGYATSPTYHKKLFYLIETYELWQFDFDLIRALNERE